MNEVKKKQRIICFAPGNYVEEKIQELAVKWSTNVSETIRYAINEAHSREFPKEDNR